MFFLGWEESADNRDNIAFFKDDAMLIRPRDFRAVIILY